jgi:hypothetical protein
MRLWQGDDTVTPGYWFRCEPGAKNLLGMSSFRARYTWCADVPQMPGVGETYDPRPEYGKGANPLGYPGAAMCGSYDAFVGGGVRGVDPELATLPDGSLEACFPAVPAAADFCRSASVIGDVTRWDMADFTRAGDVAILVTYGRRFLGQAPLYALPGWAALHTVQLYGGQDRATVYRRLLDGTEHFVDVTTSGDQFGGTMWRISPSSATVEGFGAVTEDGPGAEYHPPRLTAAGPGRVLILAVIAFDYFIFAGRSMPPESCSGGAGGGSAMETFVAQGVGPGLMPDYWLAVDGASTTGAGLSVLVRGG